MARIDLRNCTVYLKDGLSGHGRSERAGNAPGGDGHDVLTIDTIVLNTTDPDLVPDRGTLHDRRRDRRGRRSYRHGPDAERHESDDRHHVYARPGRGHVCRWRRGDVPVAADRDQDRRRRSQVHRSRPVQVRLGPRRLDTVREGDDVPMEVSMNFTFDQVKSGTGEAITPIEAIKGIGAASEWVSSSADLCEPYAVDVVVEDVRPCGSAQSDTYTVPRLPQREAGLRHQECQHRGLGQVQRHSSRSSLAA